MFEIKVNRNIISVQEVEPLTSGSVSVYQCHFSFDASWDGFFRSAVFRVGSLVKTVPLDNTDTCDLPWELLERRYIGLAVEVSAYGTKDETEILPTIWDKLGRVRGGAEPGEEVREFTPSVYDRIVSLIKLYSDKVKGDKGDKGDPGDGDMNASLYDPQGKEQDVFRYADDAALAVSEELAKRPNTNLLHNWYFANCVNQRGGYVVPPGTAWYLTEADLLSETSGGVLPGYRKVIAQTNTYTTFRDAAGYTLYAKPNVAVRGYVGAGYTIDRWFSSNGRGTLTVDGDGITFSANSDGTAYFRQTVDVDFAALSGRAVSLTIFFNNGVDQLVTLTGTVPTEAGEATIVSRNIGGGTFGCFVDANGLWHVQLARYAGYSVQVYAIKLELGSTQTLAHQDEGGNWVLNEIPDYGEELRKCQRYCVELTSPDDKYGVLGSGIAVSATLCRVYVPLPTSLRCIPAATFSGSVVLGLTTPAIDKIAVTAMTVDHYSANTVILNCTVASGLSAGTRYDLWQLADKNVSVLLSSDL